MPSAKPPKPPAHDAKAANTAWRSVKRPDGSEYAVFASESYVGFTAWTRALRDIVNANALYLDDVKGDLDDLRGSTDPRLDKLEADVKALQEAPQSRPFP